MSVHKRATNKNKTNIHWGFIVRVKTGKYDYFGNPLRKQISKWGFHTKKEAQQAEREFLNKFQCNKIELDKNATVEDVYLFFIDFAEKEGNYSTGTIKNYKSLFNNHLQYFKRMKIIKITPEVIRFWRKEICNKISPYVLNDCIKLLKASFNYAMEEKQINTNPFEEMKKVAIPKKLRKRFSFKQLKLLLESCKKHLPEYYCLFALSFLTGMRVGEYSALTANDIDFVNKLIYVEKQFTQGELKNRNKTKESTRIVHASEKMLEILKWHMKEFNIKDGFLFEDMNGKPVSAKWVSRKFKKLLKINGFEEDFCRVHDLRGQYVDIMHYCGISTEYIAKEVGHSNTSTTSNIYTQILQEVPIEANKRMDNELFN